MPRAWAVTYPEGKHVVAEIDPMVTRLAEDTMWFEQSDTIPVVHSDARVALRNLPDSSLDIVVGDAFHDISVPQHLVTQEFAEEIRKKLKPDGMYVLTIIDGAHEPQFLLAMLRTLFAVFDVAEIWADTAQLGSGGRSTYLMVSSNEPLPFSIIGSSSNPDRRWRRINPGEIAGSLGPEDVPILTDDYAPVDRLIGAVAARAR